MNIGVEITIGFYVIRAHPTPDGRVFIEVMLVEGLDAHDHPVGPSRTVDVDALFAEDEP